MSKTYIAAPFFNVQQIKVVERIKTILSVNGIKYFSPKDESNFKQGDDPKEILDLNCKGITESDFVIVVTDGKDVGTIWEAGYAFAKAKPILYVWLGWTPKQKFNIMLAASGVVAHDYEDVDYQIVFYQTVGAFDVNDAEDYIHE